MFNHKQLSFAEITFFIISVFSSCYDCQYSSKYDDIAKMLENLIAKYRGVFQTSKMKRFAKRVNGF